MKNCIFVLGFIFSIFTLMGQKGIDTNKVYYKNIIDLSEKLNVHFYGKQKMTSFAFDDENTGKSIRYKPNSQFNLGFGFNYKFLGIGIAFNFKFINNDDEKYGNTDRYDWQINAYGNKSVLDFAFFGYKSFYVENPKSTFPNYVEGEPNYIRPDINTFSLGLSYIYLFNHKRFSYKAAFVSTAKQKKSAGSFLLGSQFLWQKAQGDSSFFPVNSYFSELPSLKSFNRISIGVLSGYAYNFIIHKDYYLSLSLSIAQNIGKQSYSIESTFYQQNWMPGFDLLPRFATGYNFEIWYGGFSLVAKFTAIKTIKNYDGLLLNYQFGNFRLFIGRRFDVRSKKWTI